MFLSLITITHPPSVSSVTTKLPIVTTLVRLLLPLVVQIYPFTLTYTKTIKQKVRQSIETNNLAQLRVILANNNNFAEMTLDEQGTTPLQVATNHNNLTMIKLLINSGANVSRTNRQGMGPLHNACLNNNTEIATTLIRHKADVNKPNQNGLTPLHLASKQGNEEIVNLIIKTGTNIDHENNFGETPLHTAARHNHPNIIKILASHKASVNRPTTTNKPATGLTPLQKPHSLNKSKNHN